MTLPDTNIVASSDSSSSDRSTTTAGGTINSMMVLVDGRQTSTNINRHHQQQPEMLQPPPLVISPSQLDSMHITLEKNQQCTCKDCGKVFNSVWYLKQHAVKHSNDRPFKCKFCAKTYKFRSNLYQHKCPDRVKSLGSSKRSNGIAIRSSLTLATSAQQQQQHNTSPLVNHHHSSTNVLHPLVPPTRRDSPHSTASSTNTGSLTPSSAPCGSSDYIIIDPPMLIDGAVVDGTPRRRSDSLDDYRSTSSSSSIMTRHHRHRHQQQHTSILASAVSPQFLETYMQRHRNKLHQCRKCKLMFPSREYLSRHTASHTYTEMRLHRCLHCPQTFDSERDYARHKLLHAPQSPHSCRYCRGLFRSALALRRHLDQSRCCLFGTLSLINKHDDNDDDDTVDDNMCTMIGSGDVYDPYAFIDAAEIVEIDQMLAINKDQREDDDEEEETNGNITTTNNHHVDSGIGSSSDSNPPSFNTSPTSSIIIDQQSNTPPTTMTTSHQDNNIMHFEQNRTKLPMSVAFDKYPNAGNYHPTRFNHQSTIGVSFDDHDDDDDLWSTDYNSSDIVGDDGMTMISSINRRLYKSMNVGIKSQCYHPPRMPSPQEAETIFEDLFAYDSSQSIESVAHHPFNTTTIIPFTLIDEPTIVEKSKEVDVEVSVPVVVAPDVSVPDADAIKPDNTDDQSIDNHVIVPECRPYTCVICSKSFKRESHLNAHRTMQHSSLSLMKKSRQPTIMSTSATVRTVTTVNGGKMFACAMCSFQTRYLRNLNRHEKSCQLRMRRETNIQTKNDSDQSIVSTQSSSSIESPCQQLSETIADDDDDLLDDIYMQTVLSPIPENNDDVNETNQLDDCIQIETKCNSIMRKHPNNTNNHDDQLLSHVVHVTSSQHPSPLLQHKEE